MALIENNVGELPYQLTRLRPALVRGRGLLHAVHAEGQAGHRGAADRLGVGPEGAAGQRPDRHRAGDTTSTRRTCPVRWWRCSSSGRPATPPTPSGSTSRCSRSTWTRTPGSNSWTSSRSSGRSCIPGGWALLAEEYLDGIDPLYDNLESFNRWIDEDWGFNYQGPDLRAGAAVAARPRPRRRRARPRARRGRALHHAAAPARPTAAPPATRTSTRSGPASTRRRPWSATTSPSSTTRRTSPRTGAGASCPPFQFSAWQWQNTYGERPITDTLSALIFDNLFGRFPEHARCWSASSARNGCRTSSGTWTRAAAWAAPAPGSAASSPERPSADLQAARPRGALPGGRHRRAGRPHSAPSSRS